MDNVTEILRGIGKIIRLTRREKGINQGDLARAIGKSNSTLSKIETGDQIIDFPTFLELCRLLEIEPCATLLKAMLMEHLPSDANKLKILFEFTKVLNELQAPA